MARNYKEDQANEVEALDSIYCGEMEILEAEPLHKFRIPIATEDYAESDGKGLSCKLVFTFADRYPDEAPNVEIEDEINFKDDFVDRLIEHIKETIQENIGMEMIFSLVSSAQEWLNQRYDEMKDEAENERQRKVLELEEAERKKFEGTRVTVESFLAWRNEFEIDMGIAARREKIALENRKMTGKELFLCDKTLIESDIKFLMEAGDSIENVKIDESLFANIDDLELDSEDDEDGDPDYVPGKND